jgi:adenine specific DNA methylase Mod
LILIWNGINKIYSNSKKKFNKIKKNKKKKMEDKFKQEDRVILTHSAYINLHGILRYKGPIEGTVGVWLGVDLDVPF